MLLLKSHGAYHFLTPGRPAGRPVIFLQLHNVTCDTPMTPGIPAMHY